MIGITERGDAGLDHSWLNYNGPKILITKAPHLLPVDKMDPKDTIIHCTITGWGDSQVEPRVAPINVTLAAYKELSAKFHTVLRVDPIIPTQTGTEIAINVLKQANTSGRVRISFLDAYAHVRQRLMADGLNDLPWTGLHAPLEMRRESLKEIVKYAPQVEICGEPDMICTGCVSTIDMVFFGIREYITGISQRPNCKCVSLKKELLTNKKRCFHGCLYCYWKG